MRPSSRTARLAPPARALSATNMSARRLRHHHRAAAARRAVLMSVDVDSSETLDLTEENVEIVLDQVT